MNEIGLRRVLNELEGFAAEDHRARRDGEILADLEFPIVHLARHAEIVGQVVDEILHAVQQALAAGFGNALQRSRVAEQRIGRRESFGEQLQHEAGALAVLGGRVGAIEHAIQHRAPGDEALHEPLVVTIFLPDHVAESPVARIGSDLRTAHRDVDGLAREGEVLFDEHLRIYCHEPQQSFARG